MFSRNIAGDVMVMSACTDRESTLQSLLAHVCKALQHVTEGTWHVYSLGGACGKL